MPIWGRPQEVGKDKPSVLLAASTAPGMTFLVTASSNVASIEDIVECNAYILVLL